MIAGFDLRSWRKLDSDANKIRGRGEINSIVCAAPLGLSEPGLAKKITDTCFPVRSGKPSCGHGEGPRVTWLTRTKAPPHLILLENWTYQSRFWSQGREIQPLFLTSQFSATSNQGT